MGEAKRRRLRGCTCPKSEGIILPEHVEGCPARPKATPQYEEETIVIPKALQARISEEWNASPYHNKFPRSHYLLLLIEAACNHEQKLREQKTSAAPGSGALIEVHTKLPEGMAEASERLRKLKEGVA
jgi:hypothetical protein